MASERSSVTALGGATKELQAMTSKERIQAAMRHETVDHLPLTIEGVCHGWAKFVNDRYPDPLAGAKACTPTGWDQSAGEFRSAVGVRPSGRS
jgi:hypothetical protein